MNLSIDGFRTVLGKDRRIVLLHDGKRYKARDVTEVLYMLPPGGKDVCPHCGNKCISRYVVKAGEIIFFVTGCLLYDVVIEVYSFDTVDGLERHLIRRGYTEILERILSTTTTSDEETDSY